MKISQRTAPARATAALAVGLVAMPGALAGTHPAASQPAATQPATHSAATRPATAPAKPPPAASAAPALSGPALTISISDGRSAARAGDKLTYTVRVRNTGTVAVRRLGVTQTLSGLTFLSASAHGAAAAGHVSWTATLPAGGSQTFADVARVTKTPPALLRLAAVACVTLPGNSRPVVCAAHLDRLPTVAAGPASRSGHPVGNVPTYIAAGLAALVLGLLAAIAVRRRGRVRRQPA